MHATPMPIPHTLFHFQNPTQCVTPCSNVSASQSLLSCCALLSSVPQHFPHDASSCSASRTWWGEQSTIHFELFHRHCSTKICVHTLQANLSSKRAIMPQARRQRTNVPDQGAPPFDLQSCCSCPVLMQLELTLLDTLCLHAKHVPAAMSCC